MQIRHNNSVRSVLTHLIIQLARAPTTATPSGDVSACSGFPSTRFSLTLQRTGGGQCFQRVLPLKTADIIAVCKVGALGYVRTS